VNALDDNASAIADTPLPMGFSRTAGQSIAISCLIDRDAKFHRQLRRFVAALLHAGADAELHLIVHHIGPRPVTACDLPFPNEIRYRRVERFGTGNDAVYCNKLQQLEGLIELNSDHVVLCDADLCFLSPPRDLIGSGCVRARVVDRENPASPILRKLLDATGYPHEELCTPPGFGTAARTHRFNCNGGLYVLGREQLRVLAPAWIRWSRFCLGRADLLGSKVVHADQLGFMLAMIETRLPFAELPAGANFPTHLPAAVYATIPGRLSSLHYHRNVLDDGRLRRVGVDRIDRWIDAANDVSAPAFA
jgi:hypothetical protein